MQDNNPTRTHRKFASDCIESHMHSVLKVSGIRYIWFGIHVRRFRSFVLALQCLLLAIRIVRLCKSIVSMYNSNLLDGIIMIVLTLGQGTHINWWQVPGPTAGYGHPFDADTATIAG